MGSQFQPLAKITSTKLKMPLPTDCCCGSSSPRCACRGCKTVDCSACCAEKVTEGEGCCVQDAAAKDCCSVEATKCCCGPASRCCEDGGSCSCPTCPPAKFTESAQCIVGCC